jgi:pimeloyl-ACP methyl ester carboxylesterase
MRDQRQKPLMSKATSVNANGVRLNVLRRPGPGTALVFVHGLTDNAEAWARTIQSLGTYYDVTSYDLRGHGSSDAPESGYEVEDHTRDLVGLVDHLGLEAFTLIGHSLGAEVTSRFAILQPARVQGLVLIDPPWHADWAGQPDERRHAMAAAWHRWLETLRALPLDEALALGREQMPDWDERDVRSWAESRRVANPRCIDGLLATRDNWCAIAKQLVTRTLLVTGEPKLGALVSPTVEQEVVIAKPDLQLLRVVGAGHAVHRDRFDVWIARLQVFLRE